MVADRSSGKPYHDFRMMTGNVIIRLFRKESHEEEFIWHRDLNDRDVLVEDGIGWKFQLDNELPVELKIGDRFKIPKMTYHRIIKGDGDLLLRIREI